MALILNPYRYAASISVPLENIVAHWDASYDESTSTLTDLTGNGRSLVVGGSWVAGTLNGVWCLDRNSSTSNNKLDTSPSHPLSAQPFGVLVVYKCASGNDLIFDTGSSSRPHFHTAGVANFTLNAGSNVSTGVARDTTPHCWYVEFNDSSSKVWKDGTQVGTTFNPGTADPNGSIMTFGNVVGGGLGIAAGSQFAEAYVCTGTQTTQNIEDSSAILMTKWGL